MYSSWAVIRPSTIRRLPLHCLSRFVHPTSSLGEIRFFRSAVIDRIPWSCNGQQPGLFVNSSMSLRVQPTVAENSREMSSLSATTRRFRHAMNERWIQMSHRRKILLFAITVGVFWAYAEHYFEERKKKKEQIVQYSETADKYVLTKESGTFPPTIAVSRSIPSVTEAFPKATRLVLYQYRTCPFCCKVRALLDYFGIGYDVVEVNPVTRSTIRWSQWKKVPQLLISLDGQENPEVYQQLNESSMIISILYSYMFQPRPITELAAAYPYISSMKDGKKVTDVGNKYSVMYEGNTARSEEEITDEQKWREWADQTLVHLLSPNVYRTPSEALQAFRWFSDTGHWEETFSHWERLFVIYVGATAMFFIGKRLKKRHRLSDDVRFSLYRECDVFAREVARRKQPFLGGERPNLADLSIYGVLSSIEGCDAFQDLLANSKIGPWYKRTQDVVKHREGRNLFKHPPLVYH